MNLASSSAYSQSPSNSGTNMNNSNSNNNNNNNQTKQHQRSSPIHKKMKKILKKSKSLNKQGQDSQDSPQPIGQVVKSIGENMNTQKLMADKHDDKNLKNNENDNSKNSNINSNINNNIKKNKNKKNNNNNSKNDTNGSINHAKNDQEVQVQVQPEKNKTISFSINNEISDVSRHDDDDAASVSTQTSNQHEHEYHYFQQSSRRLSAIVYKRKSGFRGKIKSGYVKASEKANTTFERSIKSLSVISVVSCSSHLNVNTATCGGTVQGPSPTAAGNGAAGTGTGVDDTSAVNSLPSSNLINNSSVKIWEKRRLVLEGGMLMYYHEDADIEPLMDDDDDDDSDGDSNSNMDMIPGPNNILNNSNHTYNHGHYNINNNNNNSQQAQSQFQQNLTKFRYKAKENMSKVKDSMTKVVELTQSSLSFNHNHSNHPQDLQNNNNSNTILNMDSNNNDSNSPPIINPNHHSNNNISMHGQQLQLQKHKSAINTPRGVVDLLSTRATASATHFNQYDAVHAPTPYSLSIIIKSETKWILCFDSSQELLVWLGALTDISLRQCMQMYDHNLEYANSGSNSSSPNKQQGDIGMISRGGAGAGAGAGFGGRRFEYDDHRGMVLTNTSISSKMRKGRHGNGNRKDDMSSSSPSPPSLPLLAPSSPSRRNEVDEDVEAEAATPINNVHQRRNDYKGNRNENYDTISSYMEEEEEEEKGGRDNESYSSNKQRQRNDYNDIQENMDQNKNESLPLLSKSARKTPQKHQLQKQQTLKSLSTLTTCSFIAVIVINGILLPISLVIEDLSMTILSLLVVQITVNGMIWYFLYSRGAHLIQETLYHRSRQNDNYDEIHSTNNTNLTRLNQPHTPVANTTTNTAHALQSSMTPVQSATPMTSRSFSRDTSEILEQPSFVEVTKTASDDSISSDYCRLKVRKPQAGSTTMQLENNDMKLFNKNCNMIQWAATASTSMQLRGARYLSDKKKVPSPTSLYELIKADAFDSDVQMLNVGTKFKLPTVQFDIQQGNWRAPDLLVISFSLPTTAPKIGRASIDKKGYVVTGYYRMRTSTRQILQIVTNPCYDSTEKDAKLRELFPNNECDRQIINGVKLWEKWCICAPTDQEMQKRLKFIPRGDNLREIGVPGWICKYNGKPMLIKRPGETNFLFSHSDEKMLEIDINMHPLPFMFKQAMTYLKDHYFPKMVMTFGFVIEGRDEDELPEVLLGDPLQLLHVNPDNVLKGEQAFSSGGNLSFS